MVVTLNFISGGKTLKTNPSLKCPGIKKFELSEVITKIYECLGPINGLKKFTVININGLQIIGWIV